MIKAVVICEDHTLDEYIIKPIVEKIFRDASQQVRVKMVSNPRIRGVSQALSAETHSQVIGNYPMADAFFLIVDRDCKVMMRQGKIQTRIQEAHATGHVMFGCLAIEEVEVWALALHRKDLPKKWEIIRAECHPKVVYFEPFVKKKNWQTALGKGRKTAMKDLGKK